MNRKGKIVIAVVILLVAFGAFMVFGTDGVTEPSYANSEWEVSITQQESAVSGVEYQVPVEISNVGDSRASYEVGLLVDGDEVDTQSVELDGGQNETVYLSTTFEESGGADVAISQPDVEEEEWTSWLINIQAGHLETTPSVMDSQLQFYEATERVAVGDYEETRTRQYRFVTASQFEGTGTYTDGGTFEQWYTRGTFYTENPDGSITEENSTVEEHMLVYSEIIAGFENPSSDTSDGVTTYTTEISSEENLNRVYNGTEPVLNTTYEETNVEGYQSASVEMSVNSTEYTVTNITITAETLSGESVTIEYEYNYDIEGFTVEPPETE